MKMLMCACYWNDFDNFGISEVKRILKGMYIRNRRGKIVFIFLFNLEKLSKTKKKGGGGIYLFTFNSRNIKRKLKSAFI